MAFRAGEPLRRDLPGYPRREPSRRNAGQHTRATVQRLRLRTLIGLGGLAVATAYVGRTLGLRDPIFQTAEITLLLAILLVSHTVMPVVERRERGATGEEQVGSLLEELTSAGWSVLHDLSFGHGNVDHVLIGPPGIFTVETKSHPGPITVREIHGATLEQARAQQKAIERLAGEGVEPLLVYSRAWVDRPLARRKGVRVLPARMLVPYLSRRYPTMSEDEVARARKRILSAAPAQARRRNGGLAGRLLGRAIGVAGGGSGSAGVRGGW